MKQSIMLNLLCICLISGSLRAGLRNKFRSPERQLVNACKKEKIKKAAQLISEKPHLAQFQDENGRNFAHLAVLQLNPQLLTLAIKSGVDILQEDNSGSMPIELAGQVFMGKCYNDSCRHPDHDPDNLPDGDSPEIRNAKISMLKRCPRAKVQERLKACMDVFMNVGPSKEHLKKHLDTLVKSEIFQEVGEIPTDLQKLIFSMAAPRHAVLCEKWEKGPSTFLRACPAPPAYQWVNRENKATKEWIKAKLQ